MSSKKVYIIEDDKHIRELLNFSLSDAGFEVGAYETGEKGLNAIRENIPDVVLLDLMLPGIDGYEICRRIRQDKNTQNVIIMMLTARGEEGDRVLGLEIGADDYIVKPFSVREVIARVRATLRRIDRQKPDAVMQEVISGDLNLFPEKREVYKNNIPIELKTKEFDLLYYLMINNGRVLSRKQLLDDVWGYDYFGETRTVDVHISQLRLKIEDNADEPIYIKTLRSVGYKFIDKSSEEK